MRRPLEAVGRAALEADQDRRESYIATIERRHAQWARRENRAACATIRTEAASEGRGARTIVMRRLCILVIVTVLVDGAGVVMRRVIRMCGTVGICRCRCAVARPACNHHRSDCRARGNGRHQKNQEQHAEGSTHVFSLAPISPEIASRPGERLAWRHP